MIIIRIYQFGPKISISMLEAAPKVKYRSSGQDWHDPCLSKKCAGMTLAIARSVPESTRRTVVDSDPYG